MHSKVAISNHSQWQIAIFSLQAASFVLKKKILMYRGLLYSAQDIVKKDPGRAKLKSLATAVANFTKPGAKNKGDRSL